MMLYILDLISVRGQELMLKGTSDRVGPVIEAESQSNETDEVKSKVSDFFQCSCYYNNYIHCRC